jgi:hypothetical protein
MPRSGAVTLSDVISATLTLACKQCQRKSVYSVGATDEVQPADVVDVARMILALPNTRRRFE